MTRVARIRLRCIDWTSLVVVAAALAVLSRWMLPTPQVPAEQPPAAWLNARLGPAQVPDAAALRSAFDLAQHRRLSADAEPDFEGPWQSLGPAPILDGHSGRVDAVAIHPKNPDRIYVAGSGGGVWMTTDGGSSWKAMTDQACSGAVGDLEIDPRNPEILYAATPGFARGASCGLLRSVDGGQTWDMAPLELANGDEPLPAVAGLHDIAVDRLTAGSARGTVIFAATIGAGLVRSTDSGGSSIRVHGGHGSTVFQVVQASSDPSRLYAVSTVWPPAAPGDPIEYEILRSNNGGITWDSIGDRFRVVPRLAVSPVNADLIYAGTVVRNGDRVVLRSGDGGVSWTSIGRPDPAAGFFVPQPYAGTDDTVWLADVKLWMKRGALGAWIDVTGAGPHIDFRTLVFDESGRIYAGTDGGLNRGEIRATNATPSILWSNLTGNLALAQVFPGASAGPKDPERWLIGTQDNGTLLLDERGWRAVWGGDGGYTAFDPVDHRTFYVEAQSPFGPYRCTFSSGPLAAQCVRINAGLDFSTAAFVAPMIQQSEAPYALFFATSRVYRSTNRGSSWQAVSDHLEHRRSDCARAGQRVAGSVLAVGTGETPALVAGGPDGELWIRADGEASWDYSATPGCGNVNDVSIQGSGEIDTLWIAKANGGRSRSLILRTRDRGRSWQDLTGDLPGLSATSVVHDQRRRRVFAATELGVFAADEDGGRWEPIVQGLPPVVVMDLAIDAGRDQLMAATWGRGLYRRRFALP